MARKLTAKEVAQENGYDTAIQAAERYVHEGLCPACCSEGCEVEHDGECEHGFPSLFMEMLLI